MSLHRDPGSGHRSIIHAYTKTAGSAAGGFRCDECSLSGKQVREYVGMLKRGVEIDGNVIAGFNKREL